MALPGSHVQKISPSLLVALLVCTVLVAVLVVRSGGSITSLVASSALSLNGNDAVVFFATEHAQESIVTGDVFNVDLRINSRVAVNAIGATIVIPKENFDIVGISKETSLLDLWTEETTINEDKGELHFSGGTLHAGGHQGLGTVLSISLSAKKAGRAELFVKEVSVFVHDGKGRSLPTDQRSLALSIEERAKPSAANSQTTNAPSRPSTDLNSDGKTSLVDISMLALQLLAPYNARYDLDSNGLLNLRDLSILFTIYRE